MEVITTANKAANLIAFPLQFSKTKKQILKKKKATELIEDIESPKIKILD